MTLSRIQRSLRWFLGLIVLALLVNTARLRAAQIAEDEFLTGGNAALGEYSVGDINPGPGQNPILPNFTTPWTGTTGSVWQVQAAGLDGPTFIEGDTIFQLESAGGAARYQSTGGATQFIRRPLDVAPTVGTGDTFWMSGLVRLDGPDTSGANGFAWAGFASDNNNDNSTQGYKIGFDHVGGNLDLVYRHRTGAAVAGSTTLIDGVATGETHFVVLRGSVNTNTNGDPPPGNDNIDIWVDPAKFGTVADLGVPTLSLEDFSTFSNAAFSNFILESNQLSGLGATFDEFRLGMTLQDVAPLQTVGFIPEPSSFALLGLGLCGWMRRRQTLSRI